MKKYRLQANIMKRIVPIIIMLLSFSVGFSQHRIQPENLESIKAKKVEFLSLKMNLTSEEAQKFWPLYNEFVDKDSKIKFEVRKKILTLRKGSKDGSVSEAEAEKLVTETFELKEQALALEREYFHKFKKVISTEKIVKYYMAEKEFKRKLVHSLKGERGQHKRNGNHPK